MKLVTENKNHSSKVKLKLVENDFNFLRRKVKSIQHIPNEGKWKYNFLKDEVICTKEVYQILGVDSLTLNKDFRSFYKSVSDLVYTGDLKKIRKAIKASFSGKAFQIEYRISQPNGTEKWVLTQGKPIVNRQFRVIGVEGTVKDITQTQRLINTLKNHYENLCEIQHLAKIGSFETDIVHNRTYWSEETLNIFGVSPEKYNLNFGSFLEFVHPDDLELVHNTVKNPPKEQPFDLEFRIIRPDGSLRHLYHLLEITYDEYGNQLYIRGTIQDITERKELQSKLEYTQKAMNLIQRRYQKLIQESHDVYLIISLDGRIKYISPAVERILGYKPEERIGNNILELWSNQERLKLTNGIESILKDKDKIYINNAFVRTKSGKDICTEFTLRNLLSDPAIQGIVVNWRDITDRIENQKEIVHLATHDHLTNLPNREYFSQKLTLTCKEAQKKTENFAIISLDIDGFRYVNDALGFKLGDKLIIQVAQRLESFVGDKENICRSSGDRFVILVMGAKTVEEYETIAQEIISLFVQPFKLDFYELYITVSMGISIYPKDGEDPDSLLKHSYSAWHWAKKEGKNKYVFFSSDIEDESYRQFILRNDLRTGLEKDEFKIYFQPLVNLKTLEISGAEALLRWDHPTLGMISPNDFIFLAEETGFIVDLGNWIIHKVCQSYKQWLQKGLPPIKISVNYSQPQFFEKDFVKNLKSILNEFKLDPHFLIIEITESLLMSNFEQVKSDIQKLQALGVQVALDDFGTGYSSYSYLTQFNIDILKIDRSFIQEIPANHKSTVIVHSLITMMRELGVNLVAEGIETQEQFDLLQKFKCQLGQGYIFSKPVPQKDFETLLAKKSLEIPNV